MDVWELLDHREIFFNWKYFPTQGLNLTISSLLYMSNYFFSLELSFLVSLVCIFYQYIHFLGESI